MTLAIGSVGAEVRQLQTSLNAIAGATDYRLMSTMPLLTVDAMFGRRTHQRVMEFQSRNSLVADGMVGALTLNALDFALKLLGQVVPPKPVGPYKRMFALIYAGTFHNRVCSDGRIALKSGYPKKINGVTLRPGMPLDEIGPRTAEEDCTHFISCCIGSPPVVNINNIPFQGGGLRIAQPFKHEGVYGYTYVRGLVEHLQAWKFAKIVGPQFMRNHEPETRAKIASELQPGDLLAYASEPHPNNYEHFGLLVGPTSIACHTISRWGDDFTAVSYRWITLLRLP